MNTFRERSKKLKPRDPWFGATFDEAPIRAMRDAQFISGEDKVKWLEEINELFAKRSSAPLNPVSKLNG